MPIRVGRMIAELANVDQTQSVDIQLLPLCDVMERHSSEH